MERKRIVICFLVLIFFGSLTNAQKWLWGTQGIWNGRTLHQGNIVAADNQGNAYMTGYGLDTILFGTDTLAFNRYGFFLAKYDSNGILNWAAQAQQKGFYAASDGTITTDKNNNVYVAGSFNDTISFGSHQLIFNGSADGGCPFLAKYTSDGTALWAKKAMPASSASYGWGDAIAINASGNIYVMGGFVDTVSFGSTVLIADKGGSLFLVKYDSAGNVIWAKQSDNSGLYSYVSGYSLALDNAGNAYVTGYFRDSVYFGSQKLKSRFGAFLVKYDSGGNVLWAKQAENTNHYFMCSSQGISVITDKAGNIYMAGNFSDTINFGPYILMANLNYYDEETFLTKYAPDGSVIWAKQTMGDETYFDQNGGNSPVLAADTNNHIYMDFLAYDSTFSYDGFSFNVPYKDYYWPYLGSVCITKLDTSGKMECASTYPNPNNYDDFYNTGPYLELADIGIASDESGKHIYITGTNFYDTLVFNQDTLRADVWQDLPYLARWQPCADVVNTAENIPEGNYCMFIPDAFSPNRDGYNDILYVRGACIATMDFMVFDRWGNKVFESQNINDGWDGTYKGEALNIGTYMWFLKATLLDGTMMDRKGSVALVR